MLEFTAYFAQRREPFPDHLKLALRNLSKESTRIGDLCCYERIAAGESWDPDKTPTRGVVRG